MKILVDAMGGDNAPDAVLQGVYDVINETESEIILIGKKDVLYKRSKELFGKDITKINPRIHVKNATEEIEMEDTPTVAIKTKKDSSMVVGFNMMKNGEGDVFISAGNSGALLTGATLIIGRIKGIDRPAIAGILPSYHGFLTLMDCGANTNCKPMNLLQFAQMSTIYLQNSLKIESPRVGLLNIGTEETKGNDLTKHSYKLLKKYSSDLGINFIGNVEGREAFSGDVDILVTDGFTGNVFLKTVEGFGRFVKNSLNESFKHNVWSKIAAVPSLPAIKRFAKQMDYKEYGGALFLGVRQPIVKAHGSSDAKVFKYTIKQAETFVKNKTVDTLTDIYESELNKDKLQEIRKYIQGLEEE